jgi:glucose-6-phosphate 1-epimerase
MTCDDLNEQYGLDGVLRFVEEAGLVRAEVTLASCEATVYLQGAHLTNWKPTGQEPVLYLSSRTALKPGKAIRGGVPICFPWFGGRSDGQAGPSHGFARTQPWELAFAAVLPDAGSGDRLQMTFVLGPTEESRGLGFDHFRVAYEVLVGRELRLRLTVANTGDKPLHYEEALHSYFRVGDVRKTAIEGLSGTEYVDKRDGNAAKQSGPGPVVLERFSDRVYRPTTAALTVKDSVWGRELAIQKQGSATTVVWNPWEDGSAALADMGAGEWPGFVCVEAANTAENGITLEPGTAHTLGVTVGVKA